MQINFRISKKNCNFARYFVTFLEKVQEFIVYTI